MLTNEIIFIFLKIIDIIISFPFNHTFTDIASMTLKQIVGQSRAKIDLIRMANDNRVPHALLILGKEGSGGLPLTIAFVQYLFCINNNGNDACGVCIACNKVSRLEHPDVHISFPAISPKPATKALSKYFMQQFREFIAQQPYGTTFDWLQYINAENKQGNIPAEECRNIIDTLNLKAYEGYKKVQIIWRPEYLGKEGNILLKLIEEPPADTLLFFVAENTEEILPTILSRTQVLKLTPIDTADIATGLTDRLLADSRKAAQIAHLSNGSFTEALRLVNHTDNDLFPEVRTLFNIVFTNNRLEISKFSDEWAKAGREQQKNFLQYVIQLLEQAIRLNYINANNINLPQEEIEFLKKLTAKNLSPTTLNEMVDAIAKTSYHIERNAHSKTQLHALCIRLAFLANGWKLSELLHVN